MIQKNYRYFRNLAGAGSHTLGICIVPERFECTLVAYKVAGHRTAHQAERWGSNQPAESGPNWSYACTTVNSS